MSKKVLIITYYWPPSGGSGVQRWLKFAKYLPEFGWEPIIFTPENPDFDFKDESLLKDVSDDLEVIKFPIWEPYGIYKRLLGKRVVEQGQISDKNKSSVISKLSVWVRGNFFIPDPKVFWVRPASKFLMNYVKDNNIQHIITTGPPHSMHLIGSRLKKRIPSLNWVADFRDPWSSWDLYDKLRLAFFAKKKHLTLERRVLRKANSVITINSDLQRELNIHSKTQVSLITNGYDKADFDSYEFGVNQLMSSDRNKFHIVHVGIYNELRDPLEFWDAIKYLRSKYDDFNLCISIDFYGSVSSGIISRIEEDEDLKDCVHFYGYVSHSKVYEVYAGADVLLLPMNRSRTIYKNVPGKLFEYLFVRKPILLIGTNDSDPQKIVEECKAGVFVPFDNVECLQKKILDLFSSWKRKEHLFMAHGFEKYERKNLTGKLVEILDGL